MNKFFTYINLYPMPLWLAMILAPRHRLTERASRSSTIFSLAIVHYLIALFVAIRSGRQSEPPVDFTTVERIQAMLGTRSGTVAAWAHMLALDLFTGAWIYRQSRRLQAPDWVRFSSLLFTLMAGPAGLLIFLVWRTVGTRKGEALADIIM